MDKGNNTYKDFNNLIISFFNGEITEKEIELLKQWINTSAENKKHFIEMKAAWSLTAQSQKTNREEVARALNELNKKIQSRHENLHNKENHSFGRIVRIAAVFLLTISISSLTTFFVIKYKGNQPSTENENIIYVYAPLGSKAMTLLPDGTKVWLNAGSKLTYAMNYNKRARIVKLEGEGYFDVKTNPKKPFVVKAKGLAIKAYGTSFNVKAYIEDKEVVTTLIRGKVYIEGKDIKNKVFTIQIKPNQSITCLINRHYSDLMQPVSEDKIDTKKSITTELKIPEDANMSIINTQVVKTELFTSWKDNRWVINGEEIGKLATSLERKYNIKIIFNSEELKKYKFTGIFQNETVEQVFQVLKMTAPLKFEMGQGIVTLSIDEALKIKFNKYFKTVE